MHDGMRPPAIDPERLLRDLRELAAIGRFGTGVHRPAFSEPDLEARRWLAGRMADAGLAVETDGLGNVLGRSPRSGPAALVGSHTDSVPRGGWLDGALGVAYGLEAARALAEHGPTRALAVDVVSFQDEEGTFLPCGGSRAFCGELDEAEIDAARTPEGTPLRAVLERRGLDPARRLRLDPGRYAGFLEAHIEQGPRLEAEGRAVGVVTSIVGIRRYRVLLRGRADHAGTTPMAMRRDAGAGLIDLLHGLLADFRRNAGAGTVWNVGTIALQPGAANVVPAVASCTVEFRDTEPDVLDAFAERVRAHAARVEAAGVLAAEIEEMAGLAPTRLDGRLGDLLAAAATEHGASFLRMPSGAGHDAMVLARHLPSAMLFVPSIGGRSHDVAEDTSEADIVLGCRVFTTAVGRMLRQVGGA